MRGLSEIIAIILILMIVIALSALAYTWVSGIWKLMFSPNATEIVGNGNTSGALIGIRASDILSFIKSKGCDSLTVWWDGTLKCSRNDCKADGYCKYVYDTIV